MSSRKPLQLDEEINHRPPHEPPAHLVFAGFLALGKWGILGLGLILVLVAVFGRTGAVVSADLAGLACFCGITSRIIQAEEHRLRLKD